LRRSLTVVLYVFFVCLLLAVLGGLVWVNTLYARQNPGETAFLIPWLGARTFLQYGVSPYEAQAAQRAQILHYGALAEPGQDPLRLYLPFFIEIFYFPLALITDYALARGLWTLFLQAGLAGLAVLSLRLSGGRAGRLLRPALFLFFLVWPPILHIWLDARPVILAALGVAGVLRALRAGQDELAGALLVLPLCQPNSMALFLLFIFWWMARERRWRILTGLAMTLALLSGLAFFLFPGWFLPWLRGLYSHMQFVPLFTPGRILAAWWPAIGGRLGWALTALLAVMLFLEWRAVRGRDFRHFIWTVSLTLTVSPLMGIPMPPDYAVFLLLPLTVLFALLNERWSRPRGWGVGGWLLLVLLAGGWAVYLGSVGTESYRALLATLFLWLPAIVLIGLYWVRWWAVRPFRTWWERVEAEIKNP
jgi:hypothetical protein